MRAVDIIDYEPGLQADFESLNVEWLDRYFRVEPIDAAMLGDPESHIISGGGTILFARSAGDIVGTVALKHHGDGVYELTKMAVKAARQGEGLGRRLLEAAIARYQALSGRRLYLESHRSLLAALKLYESAGFRHEPRPEPSEYERSDVYMVFHGVSCDEYAAADSRNPSR